MNQTCIHMKHSTLVMITPEPSPGKTFQGAHSVQETVNCVVKDTQFELKQGSCTYPSS
jgi:nitrite reductase/ring-hydroxylating ferredoxin subunit